MKKAILLVRVSTSEQDFQAQIYDLKNYGNSLGYQEFYIIETKETAFADLNQKIGTAEMFKYIEQNPEYNTVLTTEISRLEPYNMNFFKKKSKIITNVRKEN